MGLGLVLSNVSSAGFLLVVFSGVRLFEGFWSSGGVKLLLVFLECRFLRIGGSRTILKNLTWLLCVDIGALFGFLSM